MENALKNIKELIPPRLKRSLKRILGKHSLYLKDKLPSSLIAYDRWNNCYSNCESITSQNKEDFEIKGWIASSKELIRLTIEGAGENEANLMAREDLKKHFPCHSDSWGFKSHFKTTAETEAIKLTATFKDDSQHTRLIPLPLSEKQQQILRIKRNHSLKNILTSTNIAAKKSNVASYQFDLRSNSLQNELDDQLWTNTSSNHYDEIAQAIIGKFADGLVLDCGSGYRREYYPNVINLEIFPYPNVDVLSENEELPFKNNSFDAVFSLSVLEHLRDPQKAATELQRVLKPGGIIYVSAPFLQPLHGYPHHYFNMTHSGLKTLFEQNCLIQEQGVLASGSPIWSLSWILKSWSDGLRGKTKQEFLNKTVTELIEQPINQLNSNFVKELSPEKNLELASASYILASKKSS
ncbi:MAG TPA: class I SAM-dependent methyltransferase [Oligoflexia bacterium]|nr:class I SAM-dependent methyltransferase [Oligoflexia bacterium]HMP26683.1 class I SAM-dependent methyltransferase [Oligoflexia bacterium]